MPRCEIPQGGSVPLIRLAAVSGPQIGTSAFSETPKAPMAEWILGPRMVGLHPKASQGRSMFLTVPIEHLQPFAVVGTCK
jgi:hypothetical protein